MSTVIDTDTPPTMSPCDQVLLLMVCLVSVADAWTLADEKELKTKLFTTDAYDSSSRPTRFVRVPLSIYTYTHTHTHTHTHT